ncbi:hypothetical protein N7510_001132 [Penicillium lagena]|uniref:uncharacterized protein n=1 Tax=Penicillium lagena TaxID=94218 RepID=UPI002541436A|nr:uncharacterized protein N7510_001132 [Penicillium lagena]KAJ5624823.1 hypothetical protein N7510_001132 [Penicillium lagena]
MAYAPPYGDPYARPPYERGSYGAPPPLIRPPAIPPPPLPPGWRQEWEPSVRRAFWVEEATGRSQWEPPYVEPAYAYENRGPPGEYYAAPPGPPPVVYEERTEYVEEKKSSNAGKYLAGGVAGLAVGGLAGAFLEHEYG